MRKKILLIGADGFVGSHLYSSFKRKLSGQYDVAGTCFIENFNNELFKLDIKNSNDLEKSIRTIMPKFIILIAGNKDLKSCEQNFSEAAAINIKPTEYIINILKKHSVPSKLVYLSTDYVFDGLTGLYSENSIPKPVTNYGKTKLGAENLLIESDIDYKIIRSSALMSRGGLFFDWLIEALKKKTKLKMFDNVFFSPTPMELFCNAFCRIIENYENIKGNIIHLCGNKRFSRYEFALLIQNHMHNSHTEIIPVEENLTNSIFQKDLSMIPSTFIEKLQNKTIESYFEDEIKLIKIIPRYLNHADSRGKLEGLINFGNWKELNMIVSNTGTVRGNHYHTYTTELFIILDGLIEITAQQIKNMRLCGSTETYTVKSGDVIRIKPYINHAFKIIKQARWINILSHKIDAEKPDISRFPQKFN